MQHPHGLAAQPQESEQAVAGSLCLSCCSVFLPISKLKHLRYTVFHWCYLHKSLVLYSISPLSEWAFCMQSLYKNGYCQGKHNFSARSGMGYSQKGPNISPDIIIYKSRQHHTGILMPLLKCLTPKPALNNRCWNQVWKGTVQKGTEHSFICCHSVVVEPSTYS